MIMPNIGLEDYMNGKYPISRETLLILMDAIPANVFFKDTKCRYQMASHVCQMLNSGGDPNFTIYGKTDMEIQPDAELGRKFYEEDLKIVSEGKEYDYLQAMHFGNDTYYYQITKKPVCDYDGNVIGIVGMIGDRTEQIKMQNELDARAMLSEIKKNV